LITITFFNFCRG